ncbi:FHA domain-containing protein [Neptunicella marina]|uniref:FHA domain-containing protein n=1 Tax=Neptunicella marina TaxID=2125989 RepID=A0A8J6M0E0_9ALTE|nr:FHA domain-containing protein [Neptunicella marina]MBC3767210.1 FHA domain-containing protein [Neptunicella marina]
MNRLGRQKLLSFYDNIRHRKIISTSLLYIVTCWVILQVCSITFPIFEFDNRYFHWLLIAFIVLFPVVLVFSWFYNFSIKGLVKVVPFCDRRSLNNMAPFIDRRVHNKQTKTKVHEGWFLYAESGPLEGLEYQISHDIIIGRAVECDLTLLRSYISRHHAKISIKDNKMTVEDLHSANGTLVNGEKICRQQQVHNGDELKFKDIVFTVREYVSRIEHNALLDNTVLLD